MSDITQTPTSQAQRAVFITGAGKRIGRHLALMLGAKGWAVALHYNASDTEAAEAADQITQAGGTAVIVHADLADAASVDAVIPQAVNLLGQPLDLLINNASLFEYDSWQDWTIDSWDRHMAINLRAPAQLMQAFADQATGSDPLIVNIIDQRVWRLTPHFTSYTVSKAGLWAATRTAAQGLAPRVRVNAVGPGPVLASIHQSAEDFAAQCASTPLEHGTSPEEIGRAICFMVDAPAMTGQMIALDGGEHIEWRSHANLNPFV